MIYTVSTKQDRVIVRQVDDVETLKALSDPLRLAIMRCLMRDVRASSSVKEIAQELDQPTTRLYRHVKLLEKVGLIKVASTRIVSGITEYRYQVAQLGLRLNRDLVTEPGNASEVAAAFAATLDDFRNKLVQDILAGRLGHESQRDSPETPNSSALTPMVVTLDKKLSPERAADFRSRLEALVQEFNDQGTSPSDTVPIEFLVMFWSPRDV
jgi:DNA-binding transcriptional ArsR family regulator